MKDIFFTADWHVSHTNVINFSNRPFKDLNHMREVLIANYNSTVMGRTGYFLGDVMIKEQDDSIIKRLDGNKILILGNHDKKSHGFYHRLGFNAVLNSAIIYIGKHRVGLSHCPHFGIYRENTEGMTGGSKGEFWHGESRPNAERYTFRNNQECDFHLHGHIHSPNGGKSNPIEDRQFDVGVDANNYRPVSGSRVMSWIDKYVKLHQDR